MKILITGITGFVGASLVHYFLENKRVSIFGHSRDMRKAEEKFADYKIEFISELTTESIDKFKIDSIIHLAGIAHDLSGKYKHHDYKLVNFERTKELYEEFVKSKAKSFVFVSSI